MKRQIKGRVFRTVLCGALCAAVAMPVFAANTISDAQKEKSELEDQLGDVEDTISSLKSKSQDTEQYMEQLDKKLSEITLQLVDLEDQVEAKQAELDENQKALEEAKQTSDEQYDSMKKRIKFLYENGNEAYLEMILEAKNFADLVNKADFVKQMSEYDRNMLTEYQQTQQTIADKQVQIEKEYKQIEQLQAQTQEQKESVEAISAEKEKEYQAYQSQIKESETLAAQVEEEIEAQETIIANLEAEAARKRKAEEEAKAKAKAAAEAAAASSKSSASQSTDTTDTSASSSVSASGFVWPCPSSTRVTSEYGYRIHPLTGTKKMHNGIDIGASTGTPIVAAASGTVAAASYNSSMGNYVMIDHGDSLYTVYMHCSAFNVSAGDTVSAGSTIAFVGSTGNSTGPHLHFSVRLNGSYVNPWNYVN